MTEILQGLAGEVVTAIVLGVLGVWMKYQLGRMEKGLKAEEELKAMKQKEKDDNIKECLDKIQKSVDTVGASVLKLEQDVKELKLRDQEQDRIIRSIANTNRVNGQCTYELAQLVMVLSEGMRDQHLDGNITRAIEAYRRFESGTLGNFLTGGGDHVGGQPLN